jgi:hypothetical protein
MKGRSLLWLIGCSLVILMAGSTADAYVYNGQVWCPGTTPISYLVNTTEPTNKSGTSTFLAEIQAAASTWNGAGTRFQLSYNGNTTLLGCVADINGDCIGNQDGNNVVSMGTCNFGPNVLATSWWWYNTSTCCITEADICFNDATTWFVNSAPAGCTGNTYDLTSVALHEFGHWISLGHENDETLLRYRPVMFWAFNFCEFRRVLTADDKCGVNYAYPPLNAPPANGNCVDVHAHCTPTLNSIGLIILVALLIVTAVWVMTRRRQIVQA